MDYDDGPEEEWIEDEGEPADDVLACPSCQAEVHEDTQQCPYCGDWIIPVDPRERSRRIVWAVIVVLLALSLALITVF